MPEAGWGKLGGSLYLIQHGQILFFRLGGRDVADGSEKASMIKPIDPFESRELDGRHRFPWSAPMDHLSFVKPVDGLGESVVVAVADTADGWLDASLKQAFGVL